MQIQDIKKYRAQRIEQIQRISEEKHIEDDYTKEERIKKAVKDYRFFCAYYFPHLVSAKGKPVPNAPFHNKAAEYIKTHPRARLLLQWPRGHAKSTHLSLIIPLWLKAQGMFQMMLIVSKSQNLAIKLLGALQLELAYNSRYIRDFGTQVRQGDWEKGSFVTLDKVAFFALGRAQSPRGIKYGASRPDYIVVDDIDDDIMVRNEERSKENYQWVLESLFNTMRGGEGRFIVVGNNIGKYSIIERLSHNPNFFHSKINALDKNNKPAWPQHYTLEMLQEIRATIGELAFQKEYMNNPIIEGSIFKRLTYITPLPLKKYSALIVYTDPSFRNSDKSDFKATVLVGKTKQATFHVLRCYVRKASITNMIDWHYSLYEELQRAGVVAHFYMEANYIQDMLLNNFREEGVKRGYHLPIQGDKRAKPDKFQRIAALQPFIDNAILLLSDKERHTADMQALEEQFLLFTKGSRAHDDAPDAVEGAIYLLNRRNSEAFQNLRSGKFVKTSGLRSL